MSIIISKPKFLANSLISENSLINWSLFLESTDNKHEKILEKPAVCAFLYMILIPQSYFFLDK